jgi:hypothetical protein
MKKPVVRSHLDLLPLHQKQALQAWLTTGGRHGSGISYKAAVARLRADFGVNSSEAALCQFYQRHRCWAKPTDPPAAAATFDAKAQTLTVVIHLNPPK